MFLVVLAALAVFALVLLNYTEVPPDPVKAPSKAILFGAITLLFYAVSVVIQTCDMAHSSMSPPGTAATGTLQEAKTSRWTVVRRIRSHSTLSCSC